MPINTPQGIQGRPLGPAPKPKQRPQPELVSEHGAGQATSPAATPQGPVHPALRNVGYYGTVQQFGARVGLVRNAHLNELGQVPSPGLTLDIARSNVPDEQIPGLFNGHVNPLSTGALNGWRQANPHDVMVTRPDGHQEINSPFKGNPKLNYKMIPNGYLPVPGFHALVSAISGIEQAGKVAAENAKGAAAINYQSSPLLEFYKESQALNAKQATGAITTVKGAQQHLIDKFPNYFGTLQADGHLNDSWASQIQKFQHSQQYQIASIKQLASDHNMKPADYARAWTNKTKFVASHPLLAHMAQAVPVQYWSHGFHDPVDFAKATFQYLTEGVKNPIDYVTAPLNMTVQGAKLIFNAAGGSFAQLMADTGAMNAYMAAILPHSLGGMHMGHDKAIQYALEVAKRNPSLLNTFLPEVSSHLEGSQVLGYKGSKTIATIDNLATFAVLIARGAPELTGIRVAPGDVAAFGRNRWAQSGIRLAYNSVRNGEGLFAAAKAMEGGDAAEQLALYAQEHPEMSLQEFQKKASDVFHNRDPEIRGVLFRSLRGKSLPTPKTRADLGRHFNQASQDFENGARRAGYRAMDHGVSHTRAIINEFHRAVPQETAVFGPAGQRAAEEVRNWAFKNFNDPKMAQNLTDEFIKLKAKQDVAGLAGFQDRLYNLMRGAGKLSDAQIKEQEPFVPIIESDLPFALRLPKQDTFDKNLMGLSQRINKSLNGMAAKHRQLIMFGPFQAATGLKHAIADTGRRVLSDVGQLTGPSADGKAAASALQDAISKDAGLRRLYQSTREAARQSEAKWLLGTGPTDRLSFDMAELRNAGQLTKGHIEGAAKYLRRHLNDQALDAYTRSSADDLSPLTGYVLGNKAVREGILMNKPAYDEAARALREEILPGQMTLTGGEGFAEASKAMRARLAEEHAAIIYKRYKEIEDALAKSGTSLESLVGMDDKALAKLLSDKHVDLPVHTGEVVNESKWDNVTRRWIGTIMRPNKWNREKLFDYQNHEVLASLMKDGWSLKDAAPVAMDYALRNTVYHMLDFSNMLQVEQNLRWISYFATKHRLYWTWIAKHFIKNPWHATALQNANNELGLQNGNLNFTLGGKGFYVPLARLLWVNSREYPETSPILDAASVFGTQVAGGQAIAPAAATALADQAATSGNIVSRSDQVMLSLYRFTRAATGTGYTFAAASQGMSPIQKKSLADSVVEFAINYQHDHGHLPSEQEAIKVALLHAAWSEAVRANFPLVVPQGGTPPELKKLEAEYQKITNPAQKAAYLDQHPTLGLWFGHSSPDVWWHTQPLWAKFNAARAKLNEAKQKIIQSALTPQGVYNITPQVLKEMKTVSKQWEETITELKAQDANSWHGNAQFPAGHAEQDKGVWFIRTPGPWARQLEGDPFAARAFIHQAFPKVPFGQINKVSNNDATVALQNLRSQLSQPGQTLLPAADAKTVLTDINNQLSVLFAYPKNATAKAEGIYYSKYLIPYIKSRDAKRTQAVPSFQQDLYDQNFRAWREQHDHPVKITADGKTFSFPSVVQYGYAMQPTPIRQTWENSFVHDNPLNLAPYEIKMVYGGNMVVGKQLSEAQTTWASWLKAYHDQGATVTKQDKYFLAKTLDRYYPQSNFLSVYKWSLAPKIDRFTISQPYKTMDAATRAEFDSVIGQPAKQWARAIAANGNANYYKAQWRKWVDSPTGLQEELAKYPALKAEVNRFGANFLYTLIGN